MSPGSCQHVMPEGRVCGNRADEHLHQKTCANGELKRHHDYDPSPHEHRFVNRCSVCGATPSTPVSAEETDHAES